MMIKQRPSQKQRKLNKSIDIRRAAMDLLSRREHSRLELVYKLQDRVEAITDLDAVLDRLSEENTLSEDRFCEAFVYSRTNKGYGPIRIKAELRERGIDQQLISKYLNDDVEAWIETLQKVIIKKYGTGYDDDPVRQSKKNKFLLQRGFTLEQISRAISSLSE